MLISWIRIGDYTGLRILVLTRRRLPRRVLSRLLHLVESTAVTGRLLASGLLPAAVDAEFLRWGDLCRRIRGERQPKSQRYRKKYTK